MKFTVVTILPELIRGGHSAGVVGRAAEAGVIQVYTVNPRDFAFDRHKTVDDTPYGGGPGMVMKAEPLLAAIDRACEPPPPDSVEATPEVDMVVEHRPSVIDHDLPGDPDDVMSTGRFDRLALLEAAKAPHDDLASTGRFDRADILDAAKGSPEDIVSTGRFTRPSLSDLQKKAQAKSEQDKARIEAAHRAAADRALAALEGTAKDDQGDVLDDESASRALEELERQAREREAGLQRAGAKREEVRGTLASVDDSIEKLSGALGGNLDALAPSSSSSSGAMGAGGATGAVGGATGAGGGATGAGGGANSPRAHRILLSPSGTPLTQARVRELAKLDHLVLVCGRYEGIDQRVIDLAIDEEISIGDYVLSGGELGALVLIDAVARYVPGVLGEATSVDDESFSTGLLEYPQYTKPADVRGRPVPPVLTSGNHAAIATWRRDQSMRRTAARRPDLWRSFQPSKADAKSFPPLRARTHLALVHHPIVDRVGAVITTALTNFDIHDLARSSMTFGLAGYHIVTPITSQREKAKHIIDAWIGDEQGEHRARALRLVRTADTIDAVIEAIREQHGAAPTVVATSAKPTSFPGAARRTSSELLAEATVDPAPVLILLGTGWGLADHLIPSVSRILAPIEGASDWNHLSVRSAGAVILDRLFGRPA